MAARKSNKLTLSLIIGIAVICFACCGFSYIASLFSPKSSAPTSLKPVNQNSTPAVAGISDEKKEVKAPEPIPAPAPVPVP